MLRQNCLLREHALGKFGPLLQAISRDAAMLVWLDSNSNVKGKPNENYARELMELFSLGVGNYTEKDIREAARAFTGWHTDGTGFTFNARPHDDGLKTVLGTDRQLGRRRRGPIVLEQPAAARFLVRKLYRFFVSETAPPDALLEPLCESFRKSDYDIAALVRTMLSSRLFYSDHAFRQRIKSPVEYVLGAVRAVYRRYDEAERGLSAAAAPGAGPPADGTMGQTLFAPPNVKGWPGGRVLAEHLDRARAQQLRRGAGRRAALWCRTRRCDVRRPPRDLPPPKALDPARLLDEETGRAPRRTSFACCSIAYVPGGVRPQSSDEARRLPRRRETDRAATSPGASARPSTRS